MSDEEPVYELDPITLLEEREFISSPLSVMVDFNDLLADYDEARAFEIIGKLKDLLT